MLTKTKDELQTEHDALQARADALQAQNEAMRRDWVTLNTYLNATALHYRWCGSYEARLVNYNKAFEVLKLQGRGADYGGAYERDPYQLAQLPKLTFATTAGTRT